MAAVVHDPDLIVCNEQDTCDGIIYQIDAERKGTIAPQTGVYSFHLYPDGSIRAMKGETGEWVSVEDLPQVELQTSLTTNSYRFELKIPWSFLQSSLPDAEKMGVNFVLKNSNGQGDL